MNYSEEHLDHIGRVSANFVLSAEDLDPDIITKMTGIPPDLHTRRGETRKDYKGRPLATPHMEGTWVLSSKERVVSKDLNLHLEFLLQRLLPHQDMITELLDRVGGQSYFDVLWESSYLYAGTGPVLSAEIVRGMSLLRAAIGFDIYQIDE